MSELLDNEDLITLTGSAETRKQKSVLRKHGIPFINTASGGLSTTWEAVNFALKSGSGKTEEPNFNMVRSA